MNQKLFKLFKKHPNDYFKNIKNTNPMVLTLLELILWRL